MARTGPVTRDTSTVALGLAQIRIGNAVSNIASIGAVLVSGDSIGALATTKYTGNVDYWKLESGFPLLEDMTLPLRESSMLECEFKEISSYNLALARGIDPGAAGHSAEVSEVSEDSASGTNTWETAPITVSDDAGPVTDTFIVLFSGATAGTITGVESSHVHDFSSLTGAMAPDNGGTPYFTIPADFFTGTWAADDTYTFSTIDYAAAGGEYTDNHAGDVKLGAMTAPAFVRMEAVYTYPNGTNTMVIIFPRANAVSSVEIDMQAEDSASIPLTFEAKRADSEIDGGNAVWNDMPLGRILFS